MDLQECKGTTDGAASASCVSTLAAVVVEVMESVGAVMIR